MLQDVRFALRTLRKSPGFAAIAVLSLALGIGANSAIYSLANALIFRPLPVPRPSELVRVNSQIRGEANNGIFQYSAMSYPDFADLRASAHSFAGIAASQYSPFGTALVRDATPEMRFGEYVSGNFFDVMGVAPALGRGFQASEDEAKGRDAVVVLSNQLWKTQFASSQSAVGSTVFVNGIPFTVIGVAPEAFTGSHILIPAALYVPLAMEPRLTVGTGPDMQEDRSRRSLDVHARLVPGTALAQARAETAVIGRRLASEHPATNANCTLRTVTESQLRLEEESYGATLVFVMQGLAVVVLLIACANVTNLMLSRSGGRAREIAIRLAVGAGRGRLIRQLLTESLVIALLGGAVGLWVAQVGIDLFSQIRVPGDVPVVIATRLDTPVLLFSLAAAMASALLAGFVPALGGSRADLVTALKAGRNAEGRLSRLLGRNTLVVAQVAGALVLLVFATQAWRGVEVLLTSPAGFRTERMLTASFNPGLVRSTPEQTREFYRRLLDGARRMPGATSAALAQVVPIVPGGGNTRVVPKDASLPKGTDAISVSSNVVSDGYFETVGIPIVEGRGFLKTDRAGAAQVAVVNEHFARTYYSGASPVGRQLRLNGADGPLVEIVGVARQSKYFAMFEPPIPYLYLPLEQHQEWSLTLMVDTAGASGSLAAALRQLVHGVDAGQPLIAVRSMEEIFSDRNSVLRVLIGGVAGMGALGLVLALAGLYGLVSYRVSLRLREIGIRMAVGADRAGVLMMVLRQGMTLALAGVGVGVLVSAAASQGLQSMLHTPGFNLLLLGAVAVSLVLVAMLGAYVPARRASRVDPMSVLREE